MSLAQMERENELRKQRAFADGKFIVGGILHLDGNASGDLDEVAFGKDFGDGINTFDELKLALTALGYEMTTPESGRYEWLSVKVSKNGIEVATMDLDVPPDPQPPQLAVPPQRGRLRGLLGRGK